MYRRRHEARFYRGDVINLLELAHYAERSRSTRLARRSRDHGPRHWRDVARIGRVLALTDPGVDLDVVWAFAALHDTQRQNEFDDPEHGLRAAVLVDDLARTGRLPLDGARLKQLTVALKDHDAGRAHTDPTIAACWDADRLTLVRYGSWIRPELISTSAVRAALPTFVRLARQTVTGWDTGWDTLAEEYWPAT